MTIRNIIGRVFQTALLHSSQAIRYPSLSSLPPPSQIHIERISNTFHASGFFICTFWNG